LVDPGFDSEPLIDVVLVRHELTPAGIVLTHGHLDHVASVPDIALRHGLAVWIHPDDEVLLSDPAAGLSPESKPLLEQFYGTTTPSFRPADLRHFNDEDELSLAQIDFKVWHSPGHTPGCVVLTMDSGRLMLSGDVLFNEGVGRTDLPRSSPAAMQDSLARIMRTFDASVEVYPGHGPNTTIGRERHRVV
jgi:glyoxylase-like metal-dependent hydrolase (beta-lactamase superfamily II)